MKTRYILTIAMAVFFCSASAQSTELTKKLTRDEVPVVVVQALQRDFINITENGVWHVIYLENLKTSKLTPELYEYSFKKDGSKVEIYYKPDGTFDHSKGINHPTPTQQ